MSKNSIKVFAPATVSNVGPGYDILGFALHTPGDEVILKLTNSKGIKINNITGIKKKLPFNIYKNTATVALSSLMNKYDIKEGIEVTINKKMGVGSGLGSSAASSVAAVYGLNHLLNLKLKKKQLLLHALEGEKISSGSIHADNVAPSLFGGFILIRSYNPIDIIKIKCPNNIYCTIIYPQIEIKTSYARNVLPKKVELCKVIQQTGNLAGLIYGLSSSNYDLISKSLTDVLIEPLRAKSIKGFQEIKKSAISAGALGCSISGSGPSIFALSNSLSIAINIKNAAKIVTDNLKLNTIFYISKINKRGPIILD
ncbi:MAG: homoserine kinase [Bacteroidetes bacterium]|nr:homoserine kinase [Bacteroidota bacterium]